MSKLEMVKIPKANFTAVNALLWLRENNYVMGHDAHEKNYYMFRQSPKKDNVKYFTKKLDNGILLVYEY